MYGHPNQIFPMVSAGFSRDGHFGVRRRGGTPRSCGVRGHSLLHGQGMRNTQNHRNSSEQWMAVGGWRLAVGGWRLVAVGGLRLECHRNMRRGRIANASSLLPAIQHRKVWAPTHDGAPSSGTSGRTDHPEPKMSGVHRGRTAQPLPLGLCATFLPPSVARASAAPRATASRASSPPSPPSTPPPPCGTWRCSGDFRRTDLRVGNIYGAECVALGNQLRQGRAGARGAGPWLRRP